ncbi:hypothetical protein BU25DRAFT_461591 [Macroventuria anomochaeta]|uniref:Uncharacterized protein n=1 Tax=Macroventuria anomochaeta TaxID=301207 RepID=A0ACB6RRL0_9PLEO|nr:uncharacterized protein BU25DRAFT_461591 [Macroventuria anomochaeta]KAF2623789.1 hypothetical protein BU25DRAFT_461591 [Macroventuria anomochaeta]
MDKKHVNAGNVHPKKRIKSNKRPWKDKLNKEHKREHTLEHMVQHEIIQEEPVEHNIMIIVVDEYCVGFGGAQLERVSMLEGEDSYEVAQEVSPERFSLMQWGVACGQDEHYFDRIQHIWEPEDEQLSHELVAKLEATHKKLKEKARQQQRNALIPGTAEFHHLQRVNQKIKDDNAKLLHGVRKGRQQRRTSKQLFKEKDFKVTRKGGLDHVRYTFEIYEKELIPYYLRLKNTHPGKTIYISEDGATPHMKARELITSELEEAGVLFFDWPSKSPNLHAIEDIQNHHKKLLKKLRFETNSASKAAKDKAKVKMRSIWQ